MKHALLIGAVTGALLLGFDLFARSGGGERARIRAAWRGFALAVILACLAQIALTMRTGVSKIPEWDFRAFWVSAQVAAAGGDFYDPDAYRDIGATFAHSDDFQEEILDVGFWYPPPTMLLFVGIGRLDARTAIAVWYAVHLAALVFACFVLARVFVRGEDPQVERLDAFLLTGALALLMHGTRATFVFAQTNAVMLAMLALAFHDRERIRSGVWLALAAVVKPWAAVLGLLLLMTRRWRTLAAAFATGAVAWVLAFAVFGWGPIETYLTNPPAGRVPGYMFIERVNQSLLATVLRATDVTPPAVGSVPFPFAYLAIAAALFLATRALLMSLARRGDPASPVAWALTVVFALIIYPASLSHYTAVTVIAALALWAHRSSLPGGPWSAATLIGACYAVADLSRGARSFEVFVLWWLALAALSIAQFRGATAASSRVREAGATSHAERLDAARLC